MIAETHGPLSRPMSSPSNLVRLTPAEQCVLELVRAGCSNKEIAGALGKAESTIKHQVSSILQKAGVPSRTRLMAALR